MGKARWRMLADGRRPLLAALPLVLGLPALAAANEGPRVTAEIE